MENYLDQIIELAKQAHPDFIKFNSSSDKTDAAGKRVRKCLLQIGKLTKQGRDAIQDKRKDNKK